MMDRACMPRASTGAAKIFSVRTSFTLSLGALAASLAACAGEPGTTGLSAEAKADTLERVGAAASVSACNAAPAVSPAHEVGDPVAGPSYKHQDRPQIACEGDQCLVAWTDTRAGQARVYATRVSTTGGVLDPYGTLVGEGYAPRVAAGGGTFLVAFEGTNGLPEGFTQYQIRAARVAADGSVLDPGGIEITALDDLSRAIAPQVAHAGGGFVVLWEGLRYNPATYLWEGGVRGARVGLDGSVLDPGGVAPEGVLLVADATPRAVAPSSAGAYLLWSPYDGSQNPPQIVRGSRLGPDLALLDPGGLLIAAPVSEQFLADPVLGFDGSQNLVAWTAYAYPDEQSLVARILPDGTLREASPLPLTGMEIGVGGIAFAGSRTIVLGVQQNGGDDWIGTPKVALARLDGDGAQLDPAGQLLANRGYGPAIAAVGGKALAAWIHLDCADQDCWSARTTLRTGWIDPATGQLEAPPTPLNLSSNAQAQSVVVPQESGALVVWADSRPGPAGELGGIYATRVNAAGEALDPAGILVGAGESSAPQAVFDGQNTLVVWRRNFDVDPGPGAAWLDQDGEVLDTGPMDLSILFDYPVAAPYPQGGALLLAAYGGYGEVTRVEPSGAVVGPDPMIGLNSSYSDLLSAVSFDGANYLLVFHDASWGSSVSQLRGALMSPAGEILAPGLFPIAVDRPRVRALDVAFVNGKHVLLWQEQGGTFSVNVRAAQIGAGGQVLTPDGVEVATYGNCAFCVPGPFPASAAVSRGKHGALLAWKAPGAAAGTQEIHGAELSPSGALGLPFTLAAEAGIQGQLGLGRLGGGGGKALVTYGRFMEDEPYVIERAQARVIGGSCGGSGNP